MRAIAEAEKLVKVRSTDNYYQVECSDEGMMTEYIEACLNPVIKAIKKVGG